ncbi:CCA tRNA nucleotidyltransferase 1, mitochondrial-like [Oopsacas minuta]|uniref:CCA tRNA nucleotidyltransferase 1, mitochondrial-like n=1 Tax=Oopsacas minuta TaxID=111878 RepID=A0AAV7K198_9METZ|nr:CCA tRNA nucleotidyltransferase 1, mitochondrial-like [Oopsacas minuta]
MATNSTIQSEDTNIRKYSVKSYKGLVKPRLLKFVLDNRITDLMDCFTRNGYTVKIAGGAVRDMVLGLTPRDVDLATNATPEIMQEFLEREGYRTEPTGIKHGTIMVVLEDKLTVEVTTLRIDKVTDGRHAEVEFTNDWQLDAARRDFTVNAMFMDKSGEVTDYFNGVVDLSELRIRFVNNPVDRIQEDYLRILRYFRFYGRISAVGNKHEEHTITAIRENAGGLKTISKERIWKEFQQIIGGDHCIALIKLMYELGIAEALDLPLPGNFKELDRVWKVHKQAVFYGGCGLNPEVIFISLLEGGTEHSVGELCSRWKMSNKEKKLAILIVIQRAIFTKLVIKSSITQEAYTKHCKDLIVEGQPQSHIIQLMMYLARADEEIEKVHKWEVPVLPVTGHDLLALGLQGPELAKVKDKLKQKWKDSYYILSKEELLKLV